MPQFKKSSRVGKKYMVMYNGAWIHFGDAYMEQYRDSTGLGLYSHLDHGDGVMLLGRWGFGIARGAQPGTISPPQTTTRSTTYGSAPTSTFPLYLFFVYSCV